MTNEHSVIVYFSFKLFSIHLETWFPCRFNHKDINHLHLALCACLVLKIYNCFVFHLQTSNMKYKFHLAIVTPLKITNLFYKNQNNAVLPDAHISNFQKRWDDHWPFIYWCDDKSRSSYQIIFLLLLFNDINIADVDHRVHCTL